MLGRLSFLDSLEIFRKMVFPLQEGENLFHVIGPYLRGRKPINAFPSGARYQLHSERPETKRTVRIHPDFPL